MGCNGILDDGWSTLGGGGIELLNDFPYVTETNLTSPMHKGDFSHVICPCLSNIEDFQIFHPKRGGCHLETMFEP